jgi:hypothetical protein
MLQLCELCQDGVRIGSSFEFLMNSVTFKEVYITSILVLEYFFLRIGYSLLRLWTMVGCGGIDKVEHQRLDHGSN